MNAQTAMQKTTAPAFYLTANHPRCFMRGCENLATERVVVLRGGVPITVYLCVGCAARGAQEILDGI